MSYIDAYYNSLEFADMSENGRDFLKKHLFNYANTVGPDNTNLVTD
jgi:hypothetical protein